jgi:hypothetical protein
MSKDSAKTETQSLQLPKAPGYVTRPLEGVLGAAYNLAGTDPYQYVPQPNANDMAAASAGGSIASRYGWNNQQPSPVGVYSSGSGAGGGSGGGLFGMLGISPPNAQVYDWQAIAADRAAREPSFQQAYDGLSDQQRTDLANVMGNADGSLSMADFARYHAENGPPLSQDMKDRFAQLSGGGNQSEVMGPYGSNGFGQPMATAGKTQNPWGGSPTAQSSNTYNPLSAYGQSADLAWGAANAGPQYGDYGSVLDLLKGNAPKASAGNAQSHSLLDNWESYMSPYTDRVVDTTLANVDEYDARQLAQSQAEAAGNGAFGGSRYGVMDAILRGEQGRNRAATEAGLRDTAFNTGMGLSADDANRRQSASNLNAQLATQTSIANANSDLSRLLTGANLMHQGIANNQRADESALDRAFQGADSLRNTATTYQGNERADAGLLAQLGAQQREIERQQRTAPLSLLELITNQLGAMGVNTSQVTGISNSSTTTQRDRPGLLTSLNGGISLGRNLVGLGQDIKDLGKP